MTDTGPRMTPQEIEAFHKWKNEEAPRVMLRSISEEVLCDMWDVTYRSDGGHWTELRKVRDGVRRMIRDQEDSDSRNGTIRRAALEKIATLIAGAGALMGVNWLTKRLGITIPGVLP